MKIYAVERISIDTWTKYTGYTRREYDGIFTSWEQAAEYIKKQPRFSVNDENLFRYEYRIVESDDNCVDMAVGYDMTNLTAYCGFCGNPVEPSENYCSQCGTKLKWDMEKWNELIAEVKKRTGR